MLTRFALAVSVVLVALPTVAAEPAADAIPAARDEYEAQLAKVQQAVAEENALARKKYVAKLEALRVEYAKAGNNLRAKVVAAEIEKIKAAPLGESPRPSALPESPAIKIPLGEWRARNNAATDGPDGGVRVYKFEGDRASFRNGTLSAAFKIDGQYLIAECSNGERLRWTPCIDGRWMVETFQVGATAPSSVAFAFSADDRRFR